MDRETALKIAAEFAASVTSILKFRKIFLFGSYAENRFSEDSDIDIAVIVDDLPDNFITVSSQLWKAGWNIDRRIEPVILEVNNDLSGLVKSVLERGIEVSAGKAA